MQALGGAKNHAVVLPDADIPGAVGALMGAAFGSCGQRCMAIPLVVAVGDGTADADRRAAATDGRHARRPRQRQPQRHGAAGDPTALSEGKGYIDQGVAEGAELLVDGRELSVIGADGRPSQGISSARRCSIA